jgi:hypothetical protein
MYFEIFGTEDFSSKNTQLSTSTKCPVNFWKKIFFFGNFYPVQKPNL